MGRGNVSFFNRSNLTIRGERKERFLDFCQKQSISLGELKEQDDCWRCIISEQGLKMAMEQFTTEEVILEPGKKQGIQGLLRHWIQKPAFCLGVFLFVAGLILLSSRIWIIDVIGEEHLTKEQIVKQCYRMSLYPGVSKTSLSFSSLEEKLRNHYPLLSWVSMKLTGTRLVIMVKEKETRYDNLIIAQETPCNLIAKKDGRVTSLIVRQGRAVCKVGDQIKKGELLVSGEVPSYYSEEIPSPPKAVHASADIQAVTSCEKNWILPKWEIHSYLSGRHYPLIMEMLFQKPWFSDSVVITFQRGSWYSSSRWETDSYASYVSLQKAEVKSAVLVKQLEANFIQKGVVIIENNVKIQEKPSVWLVSCEMTLSESVGQEADIVTDQENTADKERREADS